MRKISGISVLLILITATGIAQQKSFSFEQLFKGAPTQVSQPLPHIIDWRDDEHYIESKKDPADGSIKEYIVDVKTGKAVLNTELELEDARKAPQIKGAKNITLSPNRNWVAFTKEDNNLYVYDISSKKETQITLDGSETTLNGYASWVYYEEILGRASQYKAFWWSNDSKSICFMHFNDAEVPLFPIYWSDGQHGRIERTRYPKAGDKNPEVRIGVVSTDAPQKILWANFNEKEDQYFGQPLWTPKNELWIPWMNRGQDHLEMYRIDLSTGEKSSVYTEEQKTWVDLEGATDFTFLADGKSFIRLTDKDGWQNLYLYNDKGQTNITHGNFWGTSILKIDEKTKSIYFRARKENSARFDIYKASFDGKTIARLSFGEYNFDNVLLSPSNKYYIATYSNLQTPPTLILADTKGKVLRELGNARGTAFESFQLPKTEIVRVKSADNLFDLPVLITYPLNFDPTKKYPVLISIYGGPNAGTVYDRWRPIGGASQWWAQEGLIQVAFDNRSSGHFGKLGMNFIHRQLGKYEIEDYMTCGKWLQTQPWVDAQRMLITGGSFGGYMTCMALTYGAEVFPLGIANASVTDWQLYDTHYTERFMDTPQENPEGYKATAVNSYIDRYKGLIRIVHGTADDNVHMQNSIQLINKMEESRKHFEFMLYPGERHGIGANSMNKAMHLRFENYKFYYQHLLNKPMPAGF